MLREFILGLKHWQIFLLFALPLTLPIPGLLGQFAHIFSYILYFSWMYSIGITMHALIPLHLRPQIIYFKISYLINLVMIVSAAIISSSGYNPFEDNAAYLYWIVVAIALCNMLYTFSFAARMLESVIEGEVTGLSDSIKAFFCFWFFPLGLWYIQPAVQRVLNKYATTKY